MVLCSVPVIHFKKHLPADFHGILSYFLFVFSDKIPLEAVCESLMREIIACLEEVKEVWPQYNIDGYRNIWIVKPGALSRGRGIIVFDKLQNILDFNTHPMQRDGRYVVQK
jgi:tubulin monoglycylase TTLL3/8